MLVHKRGQGGRGSRDADGVRGGPWWGLGRGHLLATTRAAAAVRKGWRGKGRGAARTVTAAVPRAPEAK